MNESRRQGHETKLSQRFEWTPAQLEYFKEVTQTEKIERVRRGEIPHNSSGIHEVTFRPDITTEEFFKFYSHLLKSPALQEQGMGIESSALWEYKNSPDFGSPLVHLNSSPRFRPYPQLFHHDGNRGIFYQPQLAEGKTHSRYAPTNFVDATWWSQVLLDHLDEIAGTDTNMKEFLNSPQGKNPSKIVGAINYMDSAIVKDLSLQAVKNGDVYEHFWEPGDLVDYGKYENLLHGQGIVPPGLTEQDKLEEQPLQAYSWKRSFFDRAKQISL